MANVSVTENVAVELNEASKPSIQTGKAVFLFILNVFLSITGQ